MKTLYDYYRTVRDRNGDHPSERYAQSAFNILAEMRPEIAEAVRGGDCDPYTVTSLNDPRWHRFVQFVEVRWYATFDKR